MASLFQKLEAEAYRKGLTARTNESRAWFRKRIKELGNINRNTLLKDDYLLAKSRPSPGRMYMFVYDPKHKETLPYYDAFPLILMVGPAENGFYGLNLHYLPPLIRAKLLDKLMETANNKRFDETTKLKINYQLLSSVAKFKEFEPCFKHYLTDHVQSKIVMVQAPEWDIAIFLPTEQFEKKNKNYVWKESKRIYRAP
jgi:hypothetical protein